MAKTAWIFSYKIKKNVSEEEFIQRTKALHDEVISKAKGFISWEHYLQGNVWTDFVLWETEEDANNATTVGQGKEVTENFYGCIQTKSLDLTMESLKAKGISLSEAIRYDWGTYEVRLSDIDGNEIVIAEFDGEKND